MSKFKVGDKVKIINRESFNHKLKVGDEGVVTSLPPLQGSNYTLDFPVVGRQVTTGEDVELVEDKIEIGDTVTFKKPSSVDGNFIVSKFGTKAYPDDTSKVTFTDNDWEYIDRLELVSKAPKQEVIAYELLKDSPTAVKGTIYDSKDAAGNWVSKNGKYGSTTIREEAFKDTTWFKPIYKPTKKVVKISKGREAIIENHMISLDGEGMSFQQFEALYQKITKKDNISTRIKPYNFEITTFKLGCQEFTKEDLQLINKELTSK